MVCALGGDWMCGLKLTDGTRQMADFAREPSDSQIDGGMRIGSGRQAAGARRGRWEEVVVVVYGGMSTTRRKRERSPPGQRVSPRAHFQSGVAVTSLAGIHWKIRFGAARRPSVSTLMCTALVD